MHTLRPQLPFPAASKERGPSKDLAPLLGGLWGLCAHPECFFSCHFCMADAKSERRLF